MLILQVLGVTSDCHCPQVSQVLKMSVMLQGGLPRNKELPRNQSASLDFFFLKDKL